MKIINNNGKLLLEGTTPIGRLVQGDCHTPNDKDMHGQPLTVKNGPNKGQPRAEYFVGVAFQKGVKEVEDMRAEWADFLRQCWPHLYQGPGGVCTLPGGISDKWIDGDAFDTTGKAWATREGFAGHWVLRASSGFAPQVYPAGRYSPADILGVGSVKLGAFVRINVTAESNLNAQKPGIYVNLRMIELCGMGAPIIRGPDASQAFSQPAGALPPGATPLAAAPAVTTPPAAPPASAAPPAPPPAPPAPVVAPLAAAVADGWAPHPAAPGFHYKGQDVVADAEVAARYAVSSAPPAPPVAPPAPPAAPPAPPYTGYAQPPGAAPPPPPVVPQGPIMTATATATYEAYRAGGWTDAQLIAAGHMLPVAGVA